GGDCAGRAQRAYRARLLAAPQAEAKRRLPAAAAPRSLSGFAHPGGTSCQMSVHVLAAVVMDAPVPRQHPLEVVSEQPLHRAELLRPGVPAGVAESGERLPRWRPREMVAGEKEL